MPTRSSRWRSTSAKASASALTRSRTPRRPVSEGRAMITLAASPRWPASRPAAGRSSGRRTTMHALGGDALDEAAARGRRAAKPRSASACGARGDDAAPPSRPPGAGGCSRRTASAGAARRRPPRRPLRGRGWRPCARAMSLSSCVSRVVCCSRAKSAALSMASAAAWQIAAAVSSSACVKVRSAPLSTSSTVPITRSLTISGSVAQLLSAQSLLISCTAGVSRGSRSDPTTAGRFVSITSRVTAASARASRWPIHASSISPRRPASACAGRRPRSR